jgi:hypothetical protein
MLILAEHTINLSIEKVRNIHKKTSKVEMMMIILITIITNNNNNSFINNEIYQ